MRPVVVGSCNLVVRGLDQLFGSLCAGCGAGGGDPIAIWWERGRSRRLEGHSISRGGGGW